MSSTKVLSGGKPNEPLVVIAMRDVLNKWQTGDLSMSMTITILLKKVLKLLIWTNKDFERINYL